MRKKNWMKELAAVTALTACLVTTPTTNSYAAGVFNDVNGSEWYAESVLYVYEQGIMTGVTDATFSPETVTSRAQFATILYRISGCPEVDFVDRFPDIKEGEWYSDAIIWAASEGIVNGYSNGMFGPADVVTREQIATLLYRYADYLERDTSARNSLSSYKDAGKVSGFAGEAMQWCVGAGIIGGKSADTLEPIGKATRAEVATMVTRYLGGYVREGVDYHIHAGGMQIPHWIQWDPRWGNETYGDGTLAQNACGPTAMAMVESFITGDTITPLDITNEIGLTYWTSSGTTWSFFTSYPKTHNFTSKNLGKDFDAVIRELNSGHPVIGSMLKGSELASAKAGHYVVLRGVTASGKILIVDPSTEERTEKEWDPSVIQAAGRNFWAFQ